MKKSRSRKSLDKYELTVELESVYKGDRDWRISKCYMEVMGRSMGFKEVSLLIKEGASDEARAKAGKKCRKHSAVLSSIE